MNLHPNEYVCRKLDDGKENFIFLALNYTIRLRRMLLLIGVGEIMREKFDEFRRKKIRSEEEHTMLKLYFQWFILDEEKDCGCEDLFDLSLLEWSNYKYFKPYHDCTINDSFTVLTHKLEKNPS